jgi:HEAT repeat protein
MKRLKIIAGSSSLIISFFLIICYAGCTQHSPFQNYTKTNILILSKQADEILRQSLDDNNSRIRTNAVEVIGTAQLYDYIDLIEPLLSDDIVPVRFAAAVAAGDTKYKPFAVKLVELTKAPDENTRLAAAYALYKLGHSDMFRTLGQAISSADLDVRANAALLLGKCGNKDAIKLLQWAMQAKDSDDRVHFASIEALARLGDKDIYPKLWSMILNINADDRIFGIQALGALGTEQAKNALITKLSDDVVEVRLAAAEQLGKFGLTTGEPEVLDVFVKNLSDKKDPTSAERINCLAALAICQIKTPSLTAYLPMLLKDNSKTVRLAAAKAVFMCLKD